MRNPSTDRSRVSASFKTGAIALVFLLIGFEIALFVKDAAVSAVVAHRDAPDTVFVYVPAGQETSDGDAEGTPSPGRSTPVTAVRKSSGHSPASEKMYLSTARPLAEPFVFDPNTASAADLVRLGFSPRQAESICAYREKGGHFHRKEDFRRSYAVSDSLYARLEMYIDIPLLDLNKADSASFDALPGIGPYYAAKMVRYRSELGGYSCIEQLLEIWKFDEEKLAGLADLVTVGPCEGFALWTLPEDSLRLHPYIRDYGTAHGIALFREGHPSDEWSIDALQRENVIPAQTADKLRRCRIVPPPGQ